MRGACEELGTVTVRDGFDGSGPEPKRWGGVCVRGDAWVTAWARWEAAVDCRVCAMFAAA